MAHPSTDPARAAAAAIFGSPRPGSRRGSPARRGSRRPTTGGPRVTHDDVKRQHRRLCLLVHPDKKPCAAADGAFKLVQAAWQALSARHPPGAANQPAPPRPLQQRQQAPPPGAPEPQPRPRPQVVQMPRRAPAPPPPRAGAPTTPSAAHQASRQKPPEKGWRSSSDGPEAHFAGPGQVPGLRRVENMIYQVQIKTPCVWAFGRKHHTLFASLIP
ncbi:hypothetical protein C2845_PM02G08990 [Panicum miliaceum]|uniref:J domain-containing protein n=1 Tax=Panicum miliaceum TaxID=4540 RepID=A0A3L6SC94_PANMI|nr:hypothetical protein C2845_PM02G08990 [Panicum miliaceum]